MYGPLLNDRERVILIRRHLGEQKWDEIGYALGHTVGRCKEIERRAITKLVTAEANGWLDAQTVIGRLRKKERRQLAESLTGLVELGRGGGVDSKTLPPVDPSPVRISDSVKDRL
jgi:sigma-70-like protein